MQVRLHRVLYTIQLRKQFTIKYAAAKYVKAIAQKPIDTSFYRRLVWTETAATLHYEIHETLNLQYLELKGTMS